MSEIVHLRQRPWIPVLMCTLLGILGAGLVSRMTPPTYRAEADLFVSVVDPAAGGINDRALFAAERVKSYVPLVTSPAVIAAVQQHAGSTRDAADLARVLRAEGGTGTVLITVSADAPTPEEARTLAATAAHALSVLVATMEGGGNPAASPVALRGLAAAELPTTPVGPRTTFNLFMGLVVGAAIGLAGVVTARQLDRTVHTTDELEGLGDLHALGAVRRDRRAAELLRPDVPEPALMEDARKLRARIDLDELDLPLAIAVVSPARREGRTAVVAALARAIAEAGWRVCVVDGDLRRPALHHLAGIDAGPGLAEAVREDVPTDAVLHDSVEGLSIVPAGDPAGEAGTLLLPHALGGVRDELLKRCDVVVIDTPPLLEGADALALARAADAVLLVARSGRTVPDDVLEATAALDDIGRRPLGAVLTMTIDSKRRAFGPRRRAPAVGGLS